jgi:hypothetical protein
LFGGSFEWNLHLACYLVALAERRSDAFAVSRAVELCPRDKLSYWEPFELFGLSNCAPNRTLKSLKTVSDSRIASGSSIAQVALDPPISFPSYPCLNFLWINTAFCRGTIT